MKFSMVALCTAAVAVISLPATYYWGHVVTVSQRHQLAGSDVGGAVLLTMLAIYAAVFFAILGSREYD